jgi:hypothetical protein
MLSTSMLIQTLEVLERQTQWQRLFMHYEEGFLKKYFVFGLRNYTSKAFLTLSKTDRVRFITYDVLKSGRKRL